MSNGIIGCLKCSASSGTFAHENALKDGWIKTPGGYCCSKCVLGEEPIGQFFAYDHLPASLQETSKPFGELAKFILTLPRNPERTVALRKLLEAKDAAVRAKIAK